MVWSSTVKPPDTSATAPGQIAERTGNLKIQGRTIAVPVHRILEVRVETEEDHDTFAVVAKPRGQLGTISGSITWSELVMLLYPRSKDDQIPASSKLQPYQLAGPLYASLFNRLSPGLPPLSITGSLGLNGVSYDRVSGQLGERGRVLYQLLDVEPKSAAIPPLIEELLREGNSALDIAMYLQRAPTAGAIASILGLYEALETAYANLDWNPTPAGVLAAATVRLGRKPHEDHEAKRDLLQRTDRAAMSTEARLAALAEANVGWRLAHELAESLGTKFRKLPPEAQAAMMVRQGFRVDQLVASLAYIPRQETSVTRATAIYEELNQDERKEFRYYLAQAVLDVRDNIRHSTNLPILTVLDDLLDKLLAIQERVGDRTLKT